MARPPVTYVPWGNFLKKEETIENHFTYFGQTYDEETGLYYLRARYYDPTTGRFTQQDPAEDGYNWYVYGNQNPVMYVDYTGEEAITISAALILLGKVVICVGGVYLFKNLQDLSKSMLQNLYETQAYRRAMSTKLSENIGWDLGEAQKSHILRGSKGNKGGIGSTKNHADIWKKFNIDPNNNEDWYKLLPILQDVVNKGYKMFEQDSYGKKGEITGKTIQYVKVFAEKGISIVVKIHTGIDGKVKLSDAWGLFN